jgi:hypothetical protein
MPSASQIDDFLRRLAGMADNVPAAPVRQLELPLPNTIGVESPADYLRRMRAAHGVDDSYGPAARSAVNNSPDIPPLAAAAAPDLSLGSPLWHQMDKGARAYDNLLKGRTANLRNQNPDLVRIAQDNLNNANAAAARRAEPSGLSELATDAAVGAGLGAGAAYVASQPTPDTGVRAEATPADLAAESSPVPSVAATDADGIPLDEAKFTEMFKRQYLSREAKRQAKGGAPYKNMPSWAAEPKPGPAVKNMPSWAAEPQPGPAVKNMPYRSDSSAQGQAIIQDLNARRRKAGGEVPEAQDLMAEAERLIAEGNTQRNSPGYRPAQPQDPRARAQMLLQKLNADRMEAGGEVPHSQQVLAEVRRLQALGDQQRWGG